MACGHKTVAGSSKKAELHISPFKEQVSLLNASADVKRVRARPSAPLGAAAAGLSLS